MPRVTEIDGCFAAARLTDPGERNGGPVHHRLQHDRAHAVTL
jgi:hypothetical protein